MGENENEPQYPQNFVKIKSELGSEDVHYSVFYEGLPEEYRLFAEQNLNETKENREKGLKKLKDYMKKENLTCSEENLIYVLRSCKYNMKKCESKLRKFLRLRQQVVNKLAEHDEKKTELILDDLMFGTLPYRDKHGRVILFTRPNVRLDLYSVEDINPYICALVLYVLSFPLSSVAGLSYIGESKTESIYIFYRIMKGYRGFVTWIMDFPMRLGKIDVLNENFLCRWFFNAMRPLMPVKLTKRVSFNGSGYEHLKKTYHPDILPENFGGNMGPLTDKFYRQRLLDFIEQLKTENENTVLIDT